MRFFVVDNEVTHLTRVQQALRTAFPVATVDPQGARVFTQWSAVTEELQGIGADSEGLIIILDLGVEAEDMLSLGSGVEHCFALKSLRPDAIFLSYTQWPDLAETQAHYRETFDGGLDKQRLMGYETVDQQVNYVRRVVSRALRSRFGTKVLYRLKDSFGLRLAVSALGEDVFDALVQEVAADWSSVEVAALTSGHSGAFVIKLSGALDGNAQRLVLKCARDSAVIEAEMNRVGEYLAELGPLAEALAPFEQHARMLPNDAGYYYRQAEIDGESLLTVLKGLEWNQDALAIVENIVSLELRAYRAITEIEAAVIRPHERFVLTPIDRGRAVESLAFLREVGDWVSEAGQWSDACSPSEMAHALQELIEDWEEILKKQKALPAVAQHGDLNPGNVLVTSANRVMLIDFSRIGRWPIGYDISRLATMLRLRLTDCANSRDWAQNRLKDWIKDEFCLVDPTKPVVETGCPASAYCDKQFREFISGCNPTVHSDLVRGYKMGAVWDLIKVLSYSDLSPFKRVWAFSACWRLSFALSLLH
jgi:hypothetical protein